MYNKNNQTSISVIKVLSSSFLSSVLTRNLLVLSAFVSTIKLQN
jgi:hypothetical protein